MLTLLGLGKGLPQSSEYRDDDFGDRLNHKYTVSLFLCFAIIVTTKQMVGDKIICWVPPEFSGEWEDYSNTYCWVKNTYILPFAEDIPKKDIRDSDLPHLAYYQWVPLIMLMQAFFFYVPYMVWKGMNGRSGTDIHSLVTTALKLHQAENYLERKTNLDSLTRQMQKFLESREKRTHRLDLSFTYILSYFCCRQCGRQKGNYLTCLYLGSKLLFVVNAIGQLFAMNLFFGANFHMYGIDYFLKFNTGSDTSLRFPRVTMCDVDARFLPGDVLGYSFQCVLPINLFHEKLYLIIWFWMAFIAVFNVYSFMNWAGKSIFRIDRHRFVRAHVQEEERSKSRIDKNTRNMMISFTDKYLAQDGVFVLRLIRENTDEIALVDIVSKLWSEFKDGNNKSLEMKPTTERE